MIRDQVQPIVLFLHLGPSGLSSAFLAQMVYNFTNVSVLNQMNLMVYIMLTWKVSLSSKDNVATEPFIKIWSSGM
jgi:hypothetical protein